MSRSDEVRFLCADKNGTQKIHVGPFLFCASPLPCCVPFRCFFFSFFISISPRVRTIFFFSRRKCVTTYRLNANGNERFIIIFLCVKCVRYISHLDERSPMRMEHDCFSFLFFSFLSSHVLLFLALRVNCSHSHCLTLAQLRCRNLGI